MKSKIKTFEDACQALNLDPLKSLPEVSNLLPHHQEAIVAHSKLVIIAEALNKEANDGKEWKPDWTNGEWDKYYPWFDMSSGSGLSYNDFAHRFSHSHVGSRLCFISRYVAEYAGKQFIKLYEQYFCLK